MRKAIITSCLLFFYIIYCAANPQFETEKNREENGATTPQFSTKMKKNSIYPVWGFFINASPGLTTINSDNLSSDLWELESKFGYNFNVGYFHSLAPWAKIKLGLGVSSYSTTLSGNGEVQQSMLPDIDNDLYTESLTLINAEYQINPIYLSVPLILEFGFSSLNKIGYYIDFGIEYSYLMNDNSKASGSYTTKGTYPEWGVTLENVPELGFYTAQSLEESTELPKGNFSVRGGAGITIPLSGVLIFRLGFAGYLGLKDLGNKQSDSLTDSSLSQETQTFRSGYINNPVTTTEGSKTRHLGIEFGLYISKRVK